MVSRSSSASLSSFSFSYLSHTSSSSPSSPSSSPDSAPSSSQDRSCGASSASSTLSIVPFLWEEKPGVLKKEMQISEGDEHKSGEGSPCLARRDGVVRAHRGDANVLSSKRLSKTFPTPRSKACSESLPPRLRPPPRLSQPEHLSSLPFHKRRHRRTPSLEDDPFWLAMVACTNDAGKCSGMRFKDRRENVEISRGDSWLVKKVHEHAVHFEQCMPRHVHAVSKGDHHSRRKELASTDVCTTKDEAASSTDGTVKSMSIHRKTHAHAHALHHHHRHHHHRADGDAYSISLASKAFKALNIARAELHGRCKAFLQQQSPPVDISCGNRLSKKRSHAPKHKLPDLFGCKNDDPLNIPPRF